LRIEVPPSDLAISSSVSPARQRAQRLRSRREGVWFVFGGGVKVSLGCRTKADEFFSRLGRGVLSGLEPVAIRAYGITVGEDVFGQLTKGDAGLFDPPGGGEDRAGGDFEAFAVDAGDGLVEGFGVGLEQVGGVGLEAADIVGMGLDLAGELGLGKDDGLMELEAGPDEEDYRAYQNRKEETDDERNGDNTYG